MSKHDKYSINNTDYTIGQDNVQKWGFDVHNAVFGVSAGLIVIFLVAILISDPATAKATLDSVKVPLLTNSPLYLFGLVISLSFFV